MNPACIKDCKYKYDQSSADIRIGDFWGETYKDNEDGVSAAIAFTQKGKRIIEESDCHLEEQPFEVAAEGQMKKNCGRAATSWLVWPILHSHFYPSSKIWNLILLPEKIINHVKWMISKNNKK